MKLKLTALLCLVVFNLQAASPTDSTHYRKLVTLAGIQFQNFALPAQDLESNFQHPGIFIGAEKSLNRKRTLHQNVVIGGYVNKEIGNGLYLYSQFGYQPRLSPKVFNQISAGVGYLAVFHPSPAYEYEMGEWKEVEGGKSQLFIPVGLSLGYNLEAAAGTLTPFLTYQVSPALFYNKTLPLNLYSDILVGLRVRLSK